MFFWIRECIGWALLAGAVYLISVALTYVSTRQVFEASAVIVAALGVMRAAILLIRINTVARIGQRDDNDHNGQQRHRSAR